MYKPSKSFVAFSQPLSSFLEQHRKEALAEVESRSEESLFSDSDSEFVSRVVQKCKVDAPVIDFDMNTARKTSKNEEGSIFIYHLSCSGDGSLLKYRPNIIGFNPPVISAGNNEVAFEVDGYSRDFTEIRNEAQSIINQLKAYTEPILNEVQRFNDSLADVLHRAINTRRDKIIKRREILEHL